MIARVTGVLFIVAGIWGLVDAGFGMESAMLMGIFPVNAVHNLAHLVLGIWGYAASQDQDRAGNYGRLAGVLYLILGAVGFAVDNPFDLMPMGGADRFLHLGVGLVLLGGGLVDAARPKTRRRSP